MDRRIYIIVSLILGLTILFLAYRLLHDFPEGRDSGIANWRIAILVEVLIAVGTAIISSTLFYALYAGTAEESVLQRVSQKAADYAIRIFGERFEYFLPSEIYPATDTPAEKFQQDFDEILKGSSIYWFKGGTANFTSSRLGSVDILGHNRPHDS